MSAYKNLLNKGELRPGEFLSELDYLITSNKKPDPSDISQIASRLRSLLPVSNGSDNLVAERIVSEFWLNAEPLRFRVAEDAEGIKKTIAVALLLRIWKSSSINQRGTSLCGPIAFLQDLCAHNPIIYVRFVTEVLTKRNVDLIAGRGSSALSLEIGEKFANSFTVSNAAQAVDYIPSACLRNYSMNVLYSSDHSLEHGYTTPGQMTQWMRKAGFSNVIDRTIFTLASDGIRAVSVMPQAHEPEATANKWAGYQGANAYSSRFTRSSTNSGDDHQLKKKLTNLCHAQLLLQGGYRIFVFCDAQLVEYLKNPEKPKNAKEGHSRHWVSLIECNASGSSVYNMSVFSWGKICGQKGPYDPALIAKYYFGFVAGHPL